jgi:hypothetical protein
VLLVCLGSSKGHRTRAVSKARVAAMHAMKFSCVSSLVRELPLTLVFLITLSPLLQVISEQEPVPPDLRGVR